MKVAMLAPITWRTPPRSYGPWEQVTSVLTEALVRNGVSVTLFATGDSETRATLASVCPKPLGEVPADHKVWECLHISQLMERASEFDIIHNHYDFLPLTYCRLIRPPMVTTIHGFSSPDILPVFQKYNSYTHYVSISNSDRDKSLNYIDTIFNGVDENGLEAGQGNGNYLLFFGRIHPDKGTAEAIKIAIASKHKLIICGLIQDQAYFDEHVKPWINDHTIIYKGNAGPAERNKLMGDAAALLHPIDFEEPFGLSVAEAIMCGTPVIAFNRGSMPEIILEGLSGYIVSDIDEAVAAVAKIAAIDRKGCRKTGLAMFSSQVMAVKYMSVYKKICKGRNGL